MRTFSVPEFFVNHIDLRISQNLIDETSIDYRSLYGYVFDKVNTTIFNPDVEEVVDDVIKFLFILYGDKVKDESEARDFLKSILLEDSEVYSNLIKELINLYHVNLQVPGKEGRVINASKRFFTVTYLDIQDQNTSTPEE